MVVKPCPSSVTARPSDPTEDARVDSESAGVLVGVESVVELGETDAVSSDNTGSAAAPIPEFIAPADEMLLCRDRVGQEPEDGPEERLVILKRWGVEVEELLISVQT